VKKSFCPVSRGDNSYRVGSTRRRQTKAVRGMKFFIFTILLFGCIAVLFYIIHLLNNPFPYAEPIKKYAAHNGLDPLLVAAVIREESHFHSLAVSNKGACGLMQLMPETAKEVAAHMGETCTRSDLMRPETNIRYGTAYLAFLMEKYNGDMVLALAAYNAGFGRVNTWIAKKKTFTVDTIPVQETREYVRKVLQSYEKYRQNAETSTETSLKGT